MFTRAVATSLSSHGYWPTGALNLLDNSKDATQGWLRCMTQQQEGKTSFYRSMLSSESDALVGREPKIEVSQCPG